jgi:hypothetical protein
LPAGSNTRERIFCLQLERSLEPCRSRANLAAFRVSRNWACVSARQISGNFRLRVPRLEFYRRARPVKASCGRDDGMTFWGRTKDCVSFAQAVTGWPDLTIAVRVTRRFRATAMIAILAWPRRLQRRDAITAPRRGRRVAWGYPCALCAGLRTSARVDRGNKARPFPSAAARPSAWCRGAAPRDRPADRR